jgi:hypothetical protein
MPDVVPHGGKVPRSVSLPVSRSDVSSPVDTGVVRTVVFIFATQELSEPEIINETFYKN